MHFGDLKRNVGRVAAIFAAITIFVHAIGEFSSARAESKTSSRKPAVENTVSTRWNHNGSAVSLIAEGVKQKILYDTPRVGLLDAGVKPGTVLFEGKKKGQEISGTAYQFYRTCKPRGFSVTGTTSDDRRQITLKGKAPLLDGNCNAMGSRDDVLTFTASQIAPSEPPKDTPMAGTPGANAAAATPSGPSEANKSTVAAAVVPSAPPAASQVTDTPAVEKSSNVKSVDPSEASNALAVASAVAPSEAPKNKQVKANPPPESATAPPSEPAKNVQATQQNAPNAANNSAAPSEPPKSTQLAAIPGEVTGAVKDDPSKSKNAATAGGVVAPNILPDTSKSDVPGTDSSKTSALAENKAVPSNPPEKMMEIVLKNGRTLRVGRDIDPEALLRIISLLER